MSQGHMLRSSVAFVTDSCTLHVDAATLHAAKLAIAALCRLGSHASSASCVQFAMRRRLAAVSGAVRHTCACRFRALHGVLVHAGRA
eukprot:9090830-Alexandrium_andersonii.AAC.1